MPAPAMGGCWLALWLWQELRLDEFWGKRRLPSRKGTRWDQVLFVLVAYRLLAPGSVAAPSGVYERSALADLLGADGALCDIHTLYRCHDRLLEHKRAVFDHWVHSPLNHATLSIIINKIEQSTLPTGPCDVAIGVSYHVSILAGSPTTGSRHCRPGPVRRRGARTR